MSTPSLPLPIPPGVDIHASKQPQTWAAVIITFTLAVTAVGLRFLARHLVKGKPGLDDWLILVSLAIATGYVGTCLSMLTHGFGRHIWVLGPNGLVDFLKRFFVVEILYNLIIVTVKFSILAFYWRIFPTRAVRIQSWVLAGVITAWGAAFVLVTIFQCKPIHGFWDKTIPASCNIDTYAYIVSNAVPNIVTDALILSMPIPHLWRLQRSTAQKISLTAIFMLGGFVCIVSIIRLVTLIKVDLTSPDLDWSYVEVGIWTVTETNIAIVSACLPSLKPILSLLLTGYPSASAKARARGHQTTTMATTTTGLSASRIAAAGGEKGDLASKAERGGIGTGSWERVGSSSDTQRLVVLGKGYGEAQG